MSTVIPNQIVNEFEALTYVFGDGPVDEPACENLFRALNTAIMAVRGAVGDDVDALLPFDPRAKELALIYTDEFYSSRGLSAKVSNANRMAVITLEQQLKMTLRKLRRKGGAAV